MIDRTFIKGRLKVGTVEVSVDCIGRTGSLASLTPALYDGSGHLCSRAANS